MRFLRIAVPVHHEFDIIHMRGDARIGAVEDRLHHVPEVEPEVAKRAAERLGMALAAHGGVAVIIEGDPVRAPDDQHGLTRAERDADNRPQALRPCLDRPQRCRGPIERTHQSAALPATRKERHVPLIVPLEPLFPLQAPNPRLVHSSYLA